MNEFTYMIHKSNDVMNEWSSCHTCGREVKGFSPQAHVWIMWMLSDTSLHSSPLPPASTHLKLKSWKLWYHGNVLFYNSNIFLFRQVLWQPLDKPSGSQRCPSLKCKLCGSSFLSAVPVTATSCLLLAALTKQQSFLTGLSNSPTTGDAPEWVLSVHQCRVSNHVS